MKWTFWPETGRTWRIGSYRVRPDAGQIRGQGKTTSVSPRAIQVLACLIEARGEPVDQSQFIESVWENNYLVGEHGLRDAIWELRKAFADEPRDPKYIQTIPRKGYRLLKLPSGRERTRALPQMVALAVLLLTLLLLVTRPSQQPPVASSAPEWTDLAPVISADGRHIAMVRASNDQIDLFVAEGSFEGAAGNFETLRQWPVEGAIQITNSKATEISPAWAHGTSDLAFMEHDPISGGCKLKVFEAAQQKLRTLAEDCHVVTAPLGHIPAQLSWSYDNGQIAYQARALDAHYIAVVNTSGPPVARRLTMPGANIDAFPAWSQTHQLAFVRLNDPMMALGELMVLNPEFQTILHCSAMPLWGLAWADDRHILAATALNNPFRLWLYNIDTGAAKPTDQSARHIQSVLNSGQLVIDYFELRSSMMNTAIKLDSPPRQLAVPGPPVAFDYSAVRDEYAVVSFVDGQHQLSLVSRDGNHRSLLTAREIYAPRFSPDGSRIGFTARESIQQFVRAMSLEIDSGALTQISSEGQLVFFGDWAEPGTGWFGVQGIPAPFGSDATLHRFSFSGESLELVAERASIHVRSSAAGDLWWSDDDGNIWHRSPLDATPQHLHTLNSRYDSWTVDPATGRLFVSVTHHNGLEVLVINPGQSPEPELAGSLATLIDPILGLELGPNESLVYLPLSHTWAGREYLPVETLISQAEQAETSQQHCIISTP